MRIGVDFDGTLVTYNCMPNGYDPSVVGNNILLMVERVRKWLRDGNEVCIFTARVHPKHKEGDAIKAEVAIKKWCVKTFGKELEVTCMKDPDMKEIWDDRAVTVEKDTGRILTEIPQVDFGNTFEAPDSLGEFLKQ